MPSLTLRFLVCLLCLLTSSAGLAASAELRSAFLQALDDPGPESRDSAALKAYPLYPWLQAKRLRERLESEAGASLDAQVREFLQAHGSAPHTQALRARWWDSLFEREQWQAFLEAVGSRPEGDERLCQWLTARQRAGDAERDRQGFVRDALHAWHHGHSMPKACDAAFDWLRERGQITAERIAERLRLALDADEHDLAAWLTKQLPEARQRIWINARLARQQPGSFLFRVDDAPVFFQDLEAGLHRLARRDADAALRALDHLLQERELPGEQRQALALAVALPLSWSRRPEALPLFRRVAPAVHDDTAFEWHVRAALWAEDWKEVARIIAAMPPDLREDARWRYWAARAAVALGRADAKSAYAEVARDRSFHGFAAAVRAGVAPTLSPKATPRRPEALQQLQAMAGVQRAREWYALEEDGRAGAELAHSLADLDPDGLEQAALLLHDWGWYRQAIAWLARSGRWDDLELRFPLPFVEDFRAAARAGGIPLVWLHTIARTESLYDPRAVSGAGARGIAQVMPGTASRVARRNGVDYRSRAQLFDVRTNLTLGAHYLRELGERFEGNWLFVVPSYNAGPGRIPGWLPEEGAIDADIWMENIPFNETRGYVQRALYHYVIVHWRLHGEPGDIAPWLRQKVPTSLP